MAIRSVIVEGFLVAIAGALLAFAANGLSPRGLTISRDYFPGGARPLKTAGNSQTPGKGTNSAALLEAITARLQAHGLQIAASNQVLELYHDPRYAQGLIVFVDARNDEHYQAGHIPGAHQFDHYQPQNYVAALLPAIQSAEQIVVYCNGGDCEDSEFAAVFLRDAAGMAASRLLVYTGGMTEWQTNGWPIETGVRNSGTFLNPKR